MTTPDRMLKWFDYHDQPFGIQSVLSPFHHAAVSVCEMCEPGPQRTICLEKLLEARDAAERAAKHPGG